MARVRHDEGETKRKQKKGCCNLQQQNIHYIKRYMVKRQKRMIFLFSLSTLLKMTFKFFRFYTTEIKKNRIVRGHFYVLQYCGKFVQRPFSLMTSYTSV